MITEKETSQLAMQLITIQKSFSSLFPPEGMNNLSACQATENMDDSKATNSQDFASPASECIDLSNCMEDSEVTVPTLNG